MLNFASEYEILEGTIEWLHKNGWIIESISIATGAGLPRIEEQRRQLTNKLEAADIKFDGRTIFKRKGPDIIAKSPKGVWKIECKGLGKGAPQTHRNNFDRAVSSVMSYLDTPGIRLGLALANDYLWAYNLSERLPSTLRESTNLWVFLFENGTVSSYEPTDDLPYPGALD